MRILLVDFDSKLPNLALMKLSAWHKQKGDDIGFHVEDPDKIYVSVVFKKNKQFAGGIPMLYPDAEVVYGGSGWGLHVKLPDEIEYIKPDYDLYDMDYSIGFTTRGCIRNCYFCIVPEKEGMIRINQHPREFHDDRFDTCMILDNNILATPDKHWEGVFNWFIDNDIKMMEHGMDIRLLTKEKAEYLSRIKFKTTLKFAFDDMNIKGQVLKGIKILQDAGIDTRNNCAFYVYCHDDSMYQDTLNRCNILRENKVSAFVMFNIDGKKSKRVTKLMRWANRRWAYWAGEFDPRRLF